MKSKSQFPSRRCLRHSAYLVALASALCVFTNVQADVIFNDDFSDGNRNGWYSTSGDRVITVNEDNNLVLPGVAWNTYTGSFLTYFTPTTLAVGDSITLGFKVNNVSVNNAGNGYRFGLLNSNGSQIEGDSTSSSGAVFNGYTGYAGFHNLTNSSTSQNIYTRSGNNDSLWTSASGAFGGGPGAQYVNFNVSANEFVDVYFSIYRLDENTASVTSTINGVSVGWNHASATEFTFDTIAINLTGQTNGERIYEYFEVTVIPEPAHFAAVFGFGLLGLLLLRRRH